MEGPRLRILKLLQRQGHASVDQVSREMGLASATVRRHLDILQRDHLIAFREVKKKTGRPEYTYYLTEAGQESLPKDYARLLGRLLQEISNLSPAEVESRAGHEMLQLLFQRMATRTVDRTQTGAQDSFRQRVAKAVTVLRQEMFEPEIQELTGSVRILLHNCPFRSAAMENASVCSYDSLVLSSMLGTDIMQQQCIHNNDGVCCYVATPSQAI